jgi:hypothetical protein
MLSLAGLSRRALIAVAALSAFAPDAAAGNRQEPIAFVKMRITDLVPSGSGSDQRVNWSISAILVHPASGFTTPFSKAFGTPVKAGQTETRAALVSQVQSLAARGLLTDAGGPMITVSPNRISVVLL